MHWKLLILLSFTVSVLCSCDNDPAEGPQDTTTEELVQAVDQELYPLPANPLHWGSDNLGFLDQLADKSIIALGEATHGTAEFFIAKHQIFEYLVENHDFRIFAIEADFGESIILNELVQRSATDAIEKAMKDTMHFWTWKTEEVKDLLLWMCNYNLGKPDEDKVHYVGVDCQYNTFHPDMVKDYLQYTNAPFFAEFASTLDESKAASEDNFASYTAEEFQTYLDTLQTLQDSMLAHQNTLVSASSEQEFQLHVRILNVTSQASEVRYFNEIRDFSVNYRDKYMAENTAWLLEHFPGEKVVLWAHNGHIANNPNFGGGGAQGYRLKQEFANEYASIGFLFSQGSFTAVGRVGEQFTGLGQQVINVTPKTNSLNYVLSQSAQAAFAVKIADLENYSVWNNAFSSGIQFFQIGAVWDNIPENYYSTFDPTFFDDLIYFDRSTAAVQLP